MVNKHNWKEIITEAFFQCEVCEFGARKAIFGEYFYFCNVKVRSDPAVTLTDITYADRFYSCNEYLMLRANE